MSNLNLAHNELNWTQITIPILTEKDATSEDEPSHVGASTDETSNFGTSTTWHQRSDTKKDAVNRSNGNPPWKTNRDTGIE